MIVSRSLIKIGGMRGPQIAMVALRVIKNLFTDNYDLYEMVKILVGQNDRD